MSRTGLIVAVLVVNMLGSVTEAQSRSQPAQPQRPGLTAQPVDAGGQLSCIIQGAHVTETAVVLSCFRNGNPSHYSAVFTPGEGSGIGAVLGQILSPGMTTSGFPESVQFGIVVRPATRATRDQCAIVMGPSFETGTYGECWRAISIGRGFR